MKVLNNLVQDNPVEITCPSCKSQLELKVSDLKCVVFNRGVFNITTSCGACKNGIRIGTNDNLKFNQPLIKALIADANSLFNYYNAPGGCE